jgi:hypothetical protein
MIDRKAVLEAVGANQNRTALQIARSLGEDRPFETLPILEQLRREGRVFRVINDKTAIARWGAV